MQPPAVPCCDHWQCRGSTADSVGKHAPGPKPLEFFRNLVHEGWSGFFDMVGLRIDDPKCEMVHDQSSLQTLQIKTKNE
jgi:hypothetical protein